MALSFDKALGIHADALRVRSTRLELLASNMANADTPHYKAKDIDFRAALDNARQDRGIALTRTHTTHITGGASDSGLDVQYRVPTQPSLDGNTVDAQLENAVFSENAIQYQASLNFLSDRFSGLRKAIKGE